MRAKPASEYSDDERRELLARQKASGMSIRAFASTVGLSAATISHWRWRLSRSEPLASKPQSSPAFVQLTVDPPSSISRPSSSVHFELLLTSGLLVRVPTAFDKDALARLLAVLGVSSC